MKKKNLLVISMFVSLLYSNINYSQLKVDNNGLVGIGTTTTNPYFNLYLGNTSKGGLLHKSGNGYFRAGQSGTNGATIGTTSGLIDFWYSSTGHNTLNAKKFNRVSDSTLKSNIVPLRNGMQTILKLKTYTYDIKNGNSLTGSNIKEYGFLSQQVKEVLPSITSLSQGILVMDYDQIIPIITDATQELYYENKEQSILIESLLTKISKLENNLYEHDLTLGESVLYQNQPNPFKESTIIKFELPSEFNSASIMLFNMNGSLVNSYKISEIATGELVIEGKTLKAGMYLYSLIVDDKEVDTKRLILQQ